MKKPVDFDELYPGRFLKAGLFGGKQVTLTISDVNLEELEGDSGKKVKGVISFEKTPMMLCLNKTNGICIREMFGRKVTAWIGKRITLFASTWNGEDCIRVWGSPDIAKDMKVSVQLPKRKPIDMTLHKVALGKTSDGQPDEEPAPARTNGKNGGTQKEALRATDAANQDALELIRKGERDGWLSSGAVGGFMDELKTARETVGLKGVEAVLAKLEAAEEQASGREPEYEMDRE